MVALGFLAQNLAIGLTFGSFGVLIKPVADELGASRAAASLGIAIILLLMGVAGPVLGTALTRYPIKRIMMIGAGLMVGGFALASQASSFPTFLLGYSLLGGIGCAALGVIPSTTLISNWFVARVGFAIGLISIPLFVALAPPLVSWIVNAHDWRTALLVQAALLLALMPLLRMIVNRPSDVGQQALGAIHVDDTSRDSTPQEAVSSRSLLGSGHFWCILLGAGLMTCGGIVIVSHLVPYATDRGVASNSAALLMSINGTFSMAGAMAFGWVADRFGARLTLGMIATLQATLWALMLWRPEFSVLALLLIGIGLCGGGVQTVFSALLQGAYGQNGFARALGLGTMLMLPFTFAAAPLAGLLFDRSGSYTLAFQLQIGAFATAAVIFLLVMARRKARA
jgi:predicted MFS family arabinose efflux permease